MADGTSEFVPNTIKITITVTTTVAICDGELLFMKTCVEEGGIEEKMRMPADATSATSLTISTKLRNYPHYLFLTYACVFI